MLVGRISFVVSLVCLLKPDLLLHVLAHMSQRNCPVSTYETKQVSPSAYNSMKNNVFIVMIYKQRARFINRDGANMRRLTMVKH